MINKSKLEILISNDDSINALGIKTLAKIMSAYGNVTVLAPMHPQSGKGTSLGIIPRQYLEERGVEGNIKYYAFDGTPVDCVKMAMNWFFKDKKPDIFVSGINHGPNSSVASLYSGTLGAAIEATVSGIPSIGISICTHDEEPDFSGVKKYLPRIIDKFLSETINSETYFNINFPAIKEEEIKGIAFGHRGKGIWKDEFKKAQDENNQDYYYISGRFVNLEPENKDADHNLVKNGYVAITPLSIDYTNYQLLKTLKETWTF